jgi:hypothetical protein
VGWPSYRDLLELGNLALMVIALFRIQDVHLSLNSRLEELIKTVREEGRLTGIAEEQKRKELL